MPCSQTPSVFVPPLESETNLNTHTEPQAKLQFSEGINNQKLLHFAQNISKVTNEVNNGTSVT
jgi:hypothetical protein